MIYQNRNAQVKEVGTEFIVRSIVNAHRLLGIRTKIQWRNNLYADYYLNKKRIKVKFSANKLSLFDKTHIMLDLLAQFRSQQIDPCYIGIKHVSANRYYISVILKVRESND